MAKTITASRGAVTLTAAYNPLTVLANVSVTATGNAIYGSASQSWTVTNQGTVQGTSGSGVYFAGGGTVANSATNALIYGGGNYGVRINAGLGAVTNLGTIISKNGAGVDFLHGGTLANSTISARIAGGEWGAYFGASGGAVTASNAGTILGTNGYGVRFGDGGALTNSGTGALVSGGYDGVYGGAATRIVNQGSIGGGSHDGVAISGGSVTNAQNGRISGGYGGVYASGAASVANDGTIQGGVAGVFLFGSGSLTNQNAGLINASYAVAINSAAGTFSNAGRVEGGALGVQLGDGGSVTNMAGATITGAKAILVLGAAGTVFEAGTVNAGATGTAVSLPANYANRLVLYPGAALTGTVSGGNTLGAHPVSTLELASGASVGTVTGVGTKYIDFETIVVDASASWVLGAGSLGSGAVLSDNGTLVNAATVATTVTLGTGALLTNAASGTIGGTGVFLGVEGPGGTVVNAGSIGASSYGISLSNAGTVTNTGLITSSGRDGVVLESGGSVTNTATARITGGQYGVWGFEGSFLTLNNQGRIIGTTNDGIYAGSGGSLTNSGTGALVQGGESGVYARGDTIAIANQGTIIGTTRYGIYGGTGSLTNLGTSALIAGGNAGVFDRATVTINNQGTIVGTAKGGIQLGAGTVTNSFTTALISGGSYGVESDELAGTVINNGTIAGAGGDGVEFDGGGGVTNSGTGARISGGRYGVYLGEEVPGTIVNDGTIVGMTSAGVSMLGEESALSNSFASALISGGTNGVYARGADTVTNLGTIVGTTGIGVDLTEGGTVFNAGTIGGATYAVQFSDFESSRLVLAPGQRLLGKADGGNGISSFETSTLELASSASAGTLSGLGSKYVNFYSVVVDPSAVWSLAGSNTIAGGSLVNAGILVLTGSLGNNGTIAGAVGPAAIYPVGLPGATGIAVAGGSLTNLAVITGGTGSNGDPTVTIPGGAGGAGGAAVNLASGTLDNAGTIIGGAGGTGGHGTGVPSLLSGIGGVGGNGGAGVSDTSGMLVNTGSITGGAGGDGGTGTNVEGTVGPGGDGIRFQAGGTLTDAGFVGGGSGAGGVADAVYFGTGASRLVLDPGASFNGTVVANAAYHNVLELASGSSRGTLSGGIGAAYVGFNTVTVDVGAQWTISSVVLGGPTFTNAGKLTGPVSLGAGAVFTNVSSGSVDNPTVQAGHIDGIDALGAVSIVNAGSIYGYGYAVDLKAGGQVTNLTNATILDSAYGGVVIHGGGTVINDGTFARGAAASSEFGVKLLNGGSVTNQSHGVISAATGVAVFGSAGTVVNAGSIATAYNPFGVGVQLAAGGRLTNLSGGLISGRYDAVVVAGGAGTIVNAGTIEGATVAVTLAPGFANRLVIDPGAVFSGRVDGGNAIGAAAVSTLELASGASVGTLSGTGAAIVNFASIVIDPGADWTIGTTVAAGVALSNNGTLVGSGVAALRGASGGAVTLVNGGVIDPAIYGVYLPGGGTITNLGTASITGTAVGVKIAGGAGTVITAGTIVGGVAAVVFGAGFADRLVVSPGAVLVGEVDGGNVPGGAAATTLELASASATGTLNGIGTAFQDFASIVIDPGANWVVAGENAISSGTTLTGNGGALDLVSGAVAVSGVGALLKNIGPLQVGSVGPTALSIENGGTVVSAAGTIANGSGAAGSSVTVSGNGSDWRVSGNLVVGNAGAASLDITAGGTVSATTLNAAAVSGSDGVISISGNNSSLITAGTLSVGTGGAGELSILSGANVNIGGDFDIGTSAGASGNVDIEDTSGTVFVGGNLNLGVNGGVAVLTVGYGSTLEVDNGGVNGGPNAVLIPFSPIDPFYSNGVTYPISSTQVQSFPAYVADSRFNLSQGVTYTLETPAIYAGSGFEIGAGTSDTEPTELVLNAGSFSANSSVTFESAVGTLVVGVNALATIEMPISGTSSFTKVVNPDAGVPLIGSFDGTLKQFQAGDVIIVDTSVAATFSQNGSIVSVIANATTLGVLTFDSIAAASAAETSGLENEVVAAPCFAAGTRIATARGEVAVEDLAVGDLLPVVLGDAPEPIVWIGQRTVNCARHPKPAQVWPVRIVAGAFGAVQPHTDLWLSPDHAVYVNDVLIPVKHLINGTTIAQVKVDTVTYYHLELPRHNVVLAEGLAVESYLDMKDGSNYANRPGPLRLYPDFSTRMWEAFGCAPLIVSGSELDLARARVGRSARQQLAAA